MRITHDELTALLDDDDNAAIIRAALIFTNTPISELRADTITDIPLSDANIADLRDTALHLINDSANRELLTDTALSLSLCPLHLHDYAICFDDDDDECAAIRTIHPSHDS